MYIKILTEGNDQSPERSVIIDQIQQVEAYRVEVTASEYKGWMLGADQVWTTGQELLENGGSVGILNIKRLSGEWLFVIYDHAAYLCNEQGKAVERFIGNTK